MKISLAVSHSDSTSAGLVELIAELGRATGGSPTVALSGVMVVLPGCPSRHEPAPSRSQVFPFPAHNFSDELARVCDSLGKSPAAWRSPGLDAAFPQSHFVMAA